MKTFSKILFCAAAALTLASCAREMEGINDAEGVKMTFTGYVDDNVDANLPIVKTSLSGLNVIWNSGDKISVFANGNNSSFTAVNLQDDNKKATFEGVVSVADTYVAMYPYQETASLEGNVLTAEIPTAQSAVAGTFASGANLSVAHSSGDVLSFKNAGAIFAITIADANCTSVTVSANEPLAGKAKFDVSGDVPAVSEVVEGSKILTLNGPFASDAKYYLVVLPGTYTGLTLSFVDAAHEATFETSLDGSLTVARNANKFLGTWDASNINWVVSEFQSYTLNGSTEVQNFIDNVAVTEVIDLTITGADVTDAQLKAVAEKLDVIRGNLTLVECGNTEGVFMDSIKYIIRDVEIRGNITLKDMTSELHPDGFGSLTTAPGDLIFDNVPKLAFWDGWSPFKNLETVKGDFKLINLGEGRGKWFGFPDLLPKLKTVEGDFQMTNCGTSYGNGELALSYVGGDFTLTNNDGLNCLDCMKHIMKIGGNVTIYDNRSKDGSINWCVVRDLLDLGIISSSATLTLGTSSSPVNIADVASCSGPSEYKSYVLYGWDAVTEFLADYYDCATKTEVNGRPAKEIVQNLTVIGADITKDQLWHLKFRVAEVKGTFTLDSVQNDEFAANGEWLNFEAIVYQEGAVDQRWDAIVLDNANLVVQNIDANINPNAFGGKVVWGGDFIFRNVNFPFDWNAFDNLEEVKGDFIFESNRATMSNFNVKKLKKVGGNLEIIACKNSFWEFKGYSPEGLTIDGDLVIRDCNGDNLTWQEWVTNSFKNIQKIGGNIILERNATGATPSNFCSIRDLYNRGGFGENTQVIIKGSDGTPVNWEDIPACE